MTSAHLLGRCDTHQRKTAADNLPDTEGEFQPCAGKLWIVFNDKAAIRIVVAAMPERVQVRVLDTSGGVKATQTAKV